MAELEATNDNSSIAVIKTNIEYIQRDINDIKTVLKEGYATKEALSELARETERRLIRIETKSNLWKWLSPTLAAILGSVLTFLIIQYFINLKTNI